MNKRIALWALLVLFASVALLLRSDKKPAPRLVNYEGFDKLSLSKKADLIRVSDREAGFLEIPWIFDVFEGFRLAKKENRPVFLYTVGGNPLADC